MQDNQPNNMIEKIRDTIQDCNISFLIGSGLSYPYLALLGDIENLLTQLDEREVDPSQRKIVRASLYKKYFEGVISKNVDILESSPEAGEILSNYHDFLIAINSIMHKRKSSILHKEVNIFTTNIDIFLEKALEDLNLECNDGFNGRFEPMFDLSNFKKLHSKKSLHYDNVAEIPTFNLLKLHGSLSWKSYKGNKIGFSANLDHIQSIIKDNIIPDEHYLEITPESTIDALISASEGKTIDPCVDAFLCSYRELMIVNPSKEKYRHTLLNLTYYEMLRIFSNELEKENSVLFVLGFSFSDEHIREITFRAANSNPTLAIYIIAYDSKAKTDFTDKLKNATLVNRNIEIIAPPQTTPEGEGEPQDCYKYDMPNIRERIFDKLFTDTDKYGRSNRMGGSY